MGNFERQSGTALAEHPDGAILVLSAEQEAEDTVEAQLREFKNNETEPAISNPATTNEPEEDIAPATDIEFDLMAFMEANFQNTNLSLDDETPISEPVIAQDAASDLSFDTKHAATTSRSVEELTRAIPDVDGGVTETSLGADGLEEDLEQSDTSAGETNPEKDKPEHQSFASLYVLRGNELYPTEDKEDGTDTSKPLSESLSGEYLNEYRDQIIPALQQGETYKVEMPGFFSTETEENIVVMEYVVVGTDDDGNVLVEKRSESIMRPREDEDEPEVEEYETGDDGYDADFGLDTDGPDANEPLYTTAADGVAPEAVTSVSAANAGDMMAISVTASQPVAGVAEGAVFSWSDEAAKAEPLESNEPRQPADTTTAPKSPHLQGPSATPIVPGHMTAYEPATGYTVDYGFDGPSPTPTSPALQSVGQGTAGATTVLPKPQETTKANLVNASTPAAMLRSEPAAPAIEAQVAMMAADTAGHEAPAETQHFTATTESATATPRAAEKAAPSAPDKPPVGGSGRDAEIGTPAVRAEAGATVHAENAAAVQLESGQVVQLRAETAPTHSTAEVAPTQAATETAPAQATAPAKTASAAPAATKIVAAPAAQNTPVRVEAAARANEATAYNAEPASATRSHNESATHITEAPRVQIEAPAPHVEATHTSATERTIAEHVAESITASNERSYTTRSRLEQTVASEADVSQTADITGRSASSNRPHIAVPAHESLAGQPSDTAVADTGSFDLDIQVEADTTTGHRRARRRSSSSMRATV